MNASAAAQSCIVDDYSFVATSSMMSASSNIVSLDPRLLSGVVGSLVSAVVSQPFEVAKVKQQNYRPLLMTSSKCPPTGLPALHHAAGAAVRSHHHPGAISTLRTVIAKDGIRGAYAGLAPTIMMSVPNYGLYLTAYDEIVSRLRQSNSSVTTSSRLHLSDNSIPLVGGAVARFVATTAVAPFEMLRTRDASLESSSASSHRQKQSSVFTELGKIVRQDGVRALYKGILPSLSRDVPFAAIYMLCLERFRDMSRPLFFKKNTILRSDIPTSPEQQVGFEFVNAALAGMVAASCTAPLDVVKTKIQSVPPPPQGHHARDVVAAATTSRNQARTMDIIRSIVHKEGLSGLWRGNQARMMKVAPQYAIMMSFYEVSKKVLTAPPS